ncbi:hypothetical protein F0L17_21155 [Streptomyces sp. TRM43335]|uniref:Uncharacterized protein n=1 Tax=Streptomyces taklimakanensis TaxID=2569853 RepID=A0A6G2BH25_9ACTN|nr:hypothetical protein [Streptomyces taklimakanensis]MTE21575.1 hypothetical protein [Streptomyces taklimakanensis]
MDDDLRETVPGVSAAGLTTSLGWFGRTYPWRRAHRREQRFLGLPDRSECPLVVGHRAGTDEGAASRDDVFALSEPSALTEDRGAHAQVASPESARRGFGERTESRVGGPVSDPRTAAHHRSPSPGARVDTSPGAGPDQAAFVTGGERHRMEGGSVEHAPPSPTSATDGRPRRGAGETGGRAGAEAEAPGPAGAPRR